MTMTTEGDFYFGSYRQKIFKLDRFLRKLSEFSVRLQVRDLISALAQVLKRLETGTFSIAVVGKAQAGKTTLVNALIGAKVLPVSSAATSILKRINYGFQPIATIVRQNRQQQEIEIEQLENYFNDDRADNLVSKITEISIQYPARYCQNDVEIIDLPGLDSNNSLLEATAAAAALANSDLAIFVLSTTSLLSKVELDFLKQQLLTQDLGRILFVVSGSDRLQDGEEANQIVKIVKEKLQQQLITDLKTKFKPDSPEYITCLSKIGQLKVFCISGIDALQAKLDRNDDLLQKSRAIGLEKNLERLLNQEKGLIFLQIATNRALLAAKAILQELEQQKSLFQAQEAQLREIYEQPLQKLKLSQQNRREKVDKLMHLKELDRLQKDILDLRAKWEREKTLVEIESNRIEEMRQETAEIAQESQLEAAQILQVIGVTCHQCGKMLAPRANFCIACGSSLNIDPSGDRAW